MKKDPTIEKINSDALKDVQYYEDQKMLLKEMKQNLAILEYNVFKAKERAVCSLKKLKKVLKEVEAPSHLKIVP